MLITRDQIFESLSEKVHTKKEELRQSMAEAIFGRLQENTDLFFVVDLDAEDIVGGPFASKQKGEQYAKESCKGIDYEVMSETQAMKFLGK